MQNRSVITYPCIKKRLPPSASFLPSPVIKNMTKATWRGFIWLILHRIHKMSRQLVLVITEENSQLFLWILTIFVKH